MSLILECAVPKVANAKEEKFPLRFSFFFYVYYIIYTHFTYLSLHITTPALTPLPLTTPFAFPILFCIRNEQPHLFPLGGVFSFNPSFHTFLYFDADRGYARIAPASLSLYPPLFSFTFNLFLYLNDIPLSLFYLSLSYSTHWPISKNLGTQILVR